MSKSTMLDRAFQLARAQLDRENSLPVRDRTPDELRRTLDIALAEQGSELESVTDSLAALLAETPSAASPRFFNQLFGGRDEIACTAEMLTPLLNTSMYTYKVAGPQVLVEQEVLDRMVAKIGYSRGEGAFCPGASLANLTAMLIARNEALPAVRDRGFGRASGEARGATIYTSADGHYSIRKNAGILGLGRDAVRHVETDSCGRMNVEALRRTIDSDRAAGFQPLLINATAGTTVLGAFDPVRAISEVARSERLWLHVDGAFGGSVALSETHRALVDGCELSDSFTWNAHKMMGVPLPCSALLVARPGLLSKHLGESADYLFQSDADALNPGTRSIQCGRRNDALKLWAAWKLAGDRGYAQRIDRLFELARHAAAAIAADPTFELLLEPESINVCFEARGRASAALCERLGEEGRLLIGHGKALGRQAIRMVCVNPQLDESDIDRALEEIRHVAETLPPAEGARDRVAAGAAGASGASGASGQ